MIFVCTRPERHIGNAFSWRGAPQPDDIVNASAGAAMEDIRAVEEGVVAVYRSSAEKAREPFFVFSLFFFFLFLYFSPFLFVSNLPFFFFFLFFLFFFFFFFLPPFPPPFFSP